MNTVEISQNLISSLSGAIGGKAAVMWCGGKESSVLWHMASQLIEAEPVFIDTGLFPPETHQLLHDTYRKGGFSVRICRNDDVLQAVHESLIHRDEIQGDQRMNYDRMTNQSTVPFTLSNFAARALLYEVPWQGVIAEYDIVFTGDRRNRRQENYYLPFAEKPGRALVVRPLLNWTEEDVWHYITGNGIPVNARYRSGYRIMDSIEDSRPDGRPAWEQELGDGRESPPPPNPLMDRLVSMRFLPPSAGAGSVNREKAESCYGTIASVLGRFPNAAVAWSGHKDATVVAYMARLVRKDIPIVFIDTKYHFRETVQWRDLMSSLYGWNIVTARNDDTYANPAQDVPDCCLHNKIMPLHRFIEEKGIDAILTGVRMDDGRGEPAVEQQKTTRGGRPYLQVNPILDWNENDVLTFLEANNLPLNPLYREGYRSIDCTYCTQKVADAPQGERTGRGHKNPHLEKLQAMGYF